jgi:signal transduction histidine kinase
MRPSDLFMKTLLKKYFIYLMVSLISLLLLANILFTNSNNAIIEQNRALQQEAISIRAKVAYIGSRIIQAADIGLRGYAIIPEARFVEPLDEVMRIQKGLMDTLVMDLDKQHYPSNDCRVLRDSIQTYVSYCDSLRHLLERGDRAGFLHAFTADRGLTLWGQYEQCRDSIGAFEDLITRQAEDHYEAALWRNYILQIILFIICVPTLLYTAYHTQKTVELSELLRVTEADKNKILREQNMNLERMVAERMKEILAQSEEMQAQSEEIAAQRDTVTVQNKQLTEAQHIIQEQNDHLEREVDARTQELKHANQELVQQNNQLEQFAFIAAHNLRSPLARILGLAHLLEFPTDANDSAAVIKRIVDATKDLDHVIRDLNTILDVKKHTSNLTDIHLPTALARVTKTLEREIDETQTTVQADFHAADHVHAVPPYIESILFNLLSNAIKYRKPEHPPQIQVRTFLEGNHVVMRVSDNGLGIDLEKHANSIFSLYKRFHLHTEGRGLGLYLIKTQMTAVGGHVEVESTLGVGTTFVLHFLRKQPNN